MVHADLKPDNVLVRDGAVVAVVDIGNAGSGTRATDLTTLQWYTFEDPLEPEVGTYPLKSLVPSPDSHTLPLETPGAVQVTLGASAMVVGAHLVWPALKVKQLVFRMEGLQDWSQLTGLERKLNVSHDADGPVYVTKYRPADPITLRANGAKIDVRSMYSYPMQGFGLHLVEDTSVVLTSDEGKSVFEWIDEYIVPMQRLVQLMTRRRGRLWWTGVAPWEAGEYPFDVCGYWLEDLEGAPRSRSINDKVQLPLGELMAGNESFLDTWFSIYRKHGQTIDVYIEEHLERGAEYVHPEAFFSAARLIERLKRKTPAAERFSDETLEAIKAAVIPQISMSEREDVLMEIQRLQPRTAKASMARFVSARQDLLEALGITGMNTDALGQLFADTRNYESHHEKRLAEKAAQGNRLVNLTGSLRW